MIQASCVIGPITPRSYEKKKKCCEPKDWVRIEDLFLRIKISLSNIVSSLDSLPKILEDLEDDPVKAKKKQLEFSTRFTRNYLCELRQKMTEIRKILEQSENKPVKGHQSVFNYFASGFQTSHQAFQNVEKNLRYIIFYKMPPQINEFLTCFGDLCFITNAAYWEGVGDKLLELEDLNNALINKLKDNEANVRKAEILKKEKQHSLLKVKKTEPKKLPPPLFKTTNNKNSEFSMYKSNRINTFEKLWKKKTKALALAKFGNKEEFQMKNSPINEESTAEKQNENCKEPPPAKEEKAVKEKEEKPRRKITKPVSENELETLVQLVTPHYISSASEPEDIELDSHKKAQTTIQSNDEESTSKNESHSFVTTPVVTNILAEEKFQMGPVLDEAFKTMFNHIMSQVMTNIDPDRQLTKQDESIRISVANEVKKSNFREDNVKLICIVEEETTSTIVPVQD